jgi:EAL domain-containing protein (putative c-di-GMP-specific phosphodiesterase class I)
VATCDIVCREALVRWQHPSKGLVGPGDFIPLAEETGLIVPLGEWVLREACAQAAQWADPSLKVAVNLSAAQFRDHALVAGVVSALAASGLDPRRLELEITESILLENSDCVVDALHRLRALGVRVVLDDFGTGYSSLSYLRRFPFDKIKIDRSFIQSVAEPGTAAIVRAIVELSRQLGGAVTAEGIETVDQFERIAALGCNEAQGFLIGKPEASTSNAHTSSSGRIKKLGQVQTVKRVASVAQG